MYSRDFVIRSVAARPALLVFMLALSGCSGEPARAKPAQAPSAEDAAQIPAEVRAAWHERLARARAIQIERLAEYRRSGRFPRNHRYNGYVPVFVDHHGTPCAVAYLMQSEGRDRDVRAIAAADNHVRIEDVSEGPLIDWILTSGLTQEEATMIQPGYPRSFLEPLRRRDEQARLWVHFHHVEHQLRATTERSLEIALERLAARQRAGKLP
jgi:hypothetical protein